MKIYVKVKTKSNIQKVTNFGSGRYLVYLRESFEGGKADDELLILLSRYLGTPLKEIRIISGINQENKVFEIK